MTNLIQRFWNKNKIRKRLVLYFLITTFLMGISNLYTYYSVRTFMLKMNSMFMSNVELNDLSNNLNLVEQNLENYLSTKRSTSLEDYIKFSDELKDRADKMPKEFTADESSLLKKDIKNTIGNYLIETSSAIQAKRGRDIDEYIAHYNEASKVLGYINIYINKLNNSQFQENTSRYLIVASKLNFIEIVNVFIVVGMIIFNIILIFWLTFKITKPIISLSHSADEISRGNFEVERINIDSNDEVSILAEAFNRMISSIKQYINEIKEKAELESRLKEQEMQNLKMKNYLKDAELQVLQSQINPHFLYNTLNTGAQIAMLEGANMACTFMEKVANLFRYNLENLDKPITLGEEIKNISTYIYILKARFEDLIEFYLEVDEGVSSIQMPCMILQPIVENAFIHGVSELEEGGKITLKAKRIEEMVEITVSDNGRGIDEEKLNQLLDSITEHKVSREQIKSGHTTGIGINNVIGRLRLFFNKEDVFSIRSIPGVGTDVIITIPLISNLRSEF